MAARRTSGKIAILVLFAATVAYVGVLMLLVEPTIWRDVPPEGMSRNGAAWSDEIAELRLYRLPYRGFPFYFEDELAPVAPLARVDDAETIQLLLQVLRDSNPEGESPWCRRVKSDAWLHVITYRDDGSVFGYVVLAPARKQPDAPAYLSGCGLLITDVTGPGVTFTDTYGAFELVREITGLSLEGAIR
ncbi:MAG: hypothetical protein JSU82_01130 [Rhodospirillales bacterium]|nr:MAG: hypothetical protein JSU82_01130 [Rhodospirillales bacterium]